MLHNDLKLYIGCKNCKNVSLSSEMLLITKMKPVFINLLLTLQAIKEENLKHVFVAHQNSKSLFSFTPLENFDSEYQLTTKPRKEDEKINFKMQGNKYSDLFFAFWYKTHLLKLNRRKYVRFY